MEKEVMEGLNEVVVETNEVTCGVNPIVKIGLAVIGAALVAGTIVLVKKRKARKAALEVNPTEEIQNDKKKN